MTIYSNPPGAMVYIGERPIGTTPVSTEFLYYGDRDIRLVKDGYKTKRVQQPIKAPVYQYFPLDFVTDNFVPWEIRDERAFAYDLEPEEIPHRDEILQNAESLRSEAWSSPTLQNGGAPRRRRAGQTIAPPATNAQGLPVQNRQPAQGDFRNRAGGVPPGADQPLNPPRGNAPYGGQRIQDLP